MSELQIAHLKIQMLAASKLYLQVGMKEAEKVLDRTIVSGVRQKSAQSRVHSHLQQSRKWKIGYRAVV